MSANVDTMIYVGDRPWHGLGKDLTIDPPKTSEQIVAAAELDWKVAAVRCKTDLHKFVQNYHAIYREDNNQVLGAVNKANPIIIQNSDTFNTVSELLGKSMFVETAASLDRGCQVFGCFKLSDDYKIFDDLVDHYFVIVNDHLRPDGKITVINTPVRVVCQNTLSEALGNNLYKVRIDATGSSATNSTICANLLYGVENIMNNLKKRAEEMYKQKVNKDYVDRLLDVMFPYKVVDEFDAKGIAANEKIANIRSQFLTSCMGADNLMNYRGTQWQVVNAVADWSQHYYKSVNKAYDLNYRMKRLPGVSSAEEMSKTAQFMKIRNKLSA